MIHLSISSRVLSSLIMIPLKLKTSSLSGSCQEDNDPKSQDVLAWRCPCTFSCGTVLPGEDNDASRKWRAVEVLRDCDKKEGYDEFIRFVVN